MLEIKGKNNTCKVFTDIIDNATVGQLTSLMNTEAVKGSKVRIMSDCHAGAGCVIGTTMTLHDKVIPNLVGVDIGCFTGDTKVWLSSGHYESIKILVGKSFIVDSFDEEQKCFVHSRAVALKTRENASLVSVTYKSRITNNITTVRCTPDHKFLVSTDTSCNYSDVTWVEAQDLVKDTRLVSEDDYVYVESVTELQEKEDVYCLTVDGTHNFVLDGGIIVHNCGMLAIKLKEKRIDFTKLDSVIRKYIPSGKESNSESKEDRTSLDVRALRCFGKTGAAIREELAYRSVGTLGGGNHFIEIDKDDQGCLWLVIHTGSRQIGIGVCKYYQDLAYIKLKDKFNGGSRKDKMNEIIDKLKSEGKQQEISKELDKFRKAYNEKHPPISHELAYVEGSDFDDYIHDMKMVQEHACCNRAEIARIILKKAKLHEIDRFETIHNYIDTENMILRKGAISAQAGERVLIPLNMRDGSLICLGKGNPDWNYSAPHGAGRLMSRAQAKEKIAVKDFQKSMEGIFTTCVGRGTIDESPMAYKPMESIIENIGDTVEIVERILPVYNFKAGSEDEEE